ncbi:hypothetical protein B0H11DRAFT_961925 [Mycena galericulata]|nr:hypothetical protein B0H11DRAFT_961925 [Mycena galericulata]
MAGAVRSQPRRSAARSAASLPYSRPKPAPPKKSPWAIATGLLNYLNPLRLRSDSRSISPIDVDDDDEPESDSPSDEGPPESLSARGRQMVHNLTAPAQPPMEPMPYLLPDSSSPKKNLDTVAAFLEQRRGQTISPLEAEGLISLIHKSTPVEEKPEPFRFSTSASLPSTPARGNSPTVPNDIFTLGTSSSTTAVSGGSPRKTLTKNPNGVYRWSGGGSARPSKNRYASPAFGTPRASPERLVFRDSPAQNDASPKRRRLETPPAATPPPVPRSAAPGPSPTRIAASKYFPFPLSSTPASSPISGSTAAAPGAPATTPARTAMIKVHSTPAHPSPLRQAWGGSPASSVSSNGSSPAQGTPTKAAALLTALIRDADAEAPPKSADVRNPYQSASPVGVRVTNTHPPDAANRKRARATGRPAERKAREAKEREENAAKEKEEKEREEKEKKREVLPPQAIIEATLPKGSKRSRPPAHFNATASLNSLAAPPVPAPRRSPRLEPQHMETDVDADAGEKDQEERDAGAPAAKRARLPVVNGSAPANGGMLNGASVPKKDAEPAPPVSTTSFSFSASVSAPSGFSDAGTGNGAGFTLGASASTNTLGSGFDFRLGPKPIATSAPKEPSKLRYSFAPPTPPPVVDKPKNLFPMDPPPPPQPKIVPAPAPAASLYRETAKAGLTQDPKDAARMMAPSTLPSFVFSVLTNAPGPEHAKAREAARRIDKGALPMFDFAAPPAQDKGKGKAREEVKPVQGFNWAAAGAAPPKPKDASGSWTCGTCMLSNGPEVTDKCSVCETPRAAPEKAPVQGFNWAAAGAAPPKPANAAGSWTCGTCMLSNGPDIKDKCSVCDSPRG